MYLTYVATVTLHFIFGVLRALILKTSNKTQLLEFFFRQLFPLEKKKILQNGSVSVFCFSRGPCKLSVTSEARLRYVRSCGTSSHTCQGRACPQSKAGVPFVMPLRAHRYLSCFLSHDLHALNRNLELFCTCLVLGTVGTWQLTAPWRGARQVNTHVLPQAPPPGAEPAPSSDYTAKFSKSQFGPYSKTVQKLFLLITLK